VTARQTFNRRPSRLGARDTGGPLPRCRTNSWTRAPLSAGLFMSQRTPRRRSSFDLARIFFVGAVPPPFTPCWRHVGESLHHQGGFEVASMVGSGSGATGYGAVRQVGASVPGTFRPHRSGARCHACQAGQVRCRSRVLTVMPATVQHHF
jgi:hypothetical protein